MGADDDGMRIHGGPDSHELARLGLSAGELLDFSVNVNPFGAAPAVLRAIHAARLDRYPDDHALAARRALAHAWQVTPDRVAVGNGAAELLWALVQLCCRGRGPLLVIEPTFVEASLAARAADIPVHRHVTRIEDDFAIDVGAVAETARAIGARAIYLTSPQNPTGRLVPPAVTAALAQAVGPSITILLDEAFLALSHGFADATVALPDNVVRVRSLTKEHALPGLRVGALIGPPALVERLASVRPAWTVSAPALAAAEVAAMQDGFVAEVRARWLADAARLRDRLLAEGHHVLPSDTVFLLVGVPGGAAALRQRLLERHRILVRDCTSFGLPAYVRLCARPAADVDALIEAWAAPA